MLHNHSHALPLMLLQLSAEKKKYFWLVFVFYSCLSSVTAPVSPIHCCLGTIVALAHLLTDNKSVYEPFY